MSKSVFIFSPLLLRYTYKNVLVMECNDIFFVEFLSYTSIRGKPYRSDQKRRELNSLPHLRLASELGVWNKVVGFLEDGYLFDVRHGVVSYIDSFLSTLVILTFLFS